MYTVRLLSYVYSVQCTVSVHIYADVMQWLGRYVTAAKEAV
jgi:hypothetical protein